MQPQQPQPQQSGKLAAIAAIRQIVNGGEPQPPEAITPDFIQYIDQFLQSEEAKKLGPEVYRKIQIYRDSIAQGQ